MIDSSPHHLTRATLLIMDSGIREKFEAMVVAIKRRNAEMLFSPKGTEQFQEDDILVLIGAREKLKEFGKVHSALKPSKK